MAADNLDRQAEEVEALSSIYGDDWILESEVSKSYCIRVLEDKREVLLYVKMPSGYPSEDPPTYEISAPWMERKTKQDLHHAIDEVYLENKGEAVIYQWVEKIREELLKIILNESKNKVVQKPIVQTETLEDEITCPEITHGEVIVDRKSSFQGHAAEVHSVEDVHAVLAKLKQNKKIANAFHNMYAYRIVKTDNGRTRLLQDCDDDGENMAGGRMAHLMDILDVKNALVVVSRWYGGIQLGPDRFRHINNATRQVLIQSGLFVDKKL